MGLLLGIAVSFTGAWLYARRACLGRCGDNTRCVDRVCVATPSTAPAVNPPTREPHHKRRGGDSGAAPVTQLHPGDEKMITQGDTLGRPEYIDLSSSDSRELSQDDLDHVFKANDPAITRCITDALGDAPLESARVEVGLRVERDGSVHRVRVEAPALLQHHGLTRCIRGVVVALHFPASSGASTVTYPFEVK
jgi:hypothetical protein